MTESAFSIEELEDLYCLFKVRTNCQVTLCCSGRGSSLLRLTCESLCFQRPVQTHDQLLLGPQRLCG